MRMGVGVGEATLSPAAYSLIADYFPPNRRSTAMSVYSMGIYIGSGLAFILGGMVVQFATVQESFTFPLIGDVRSWQLVFFVVGLPGLLVALLLFLTVREPIRRGGIREGQPAPRTATIGETKAYIFDNLTTFICLNFGIALLTLSAYAGTSWIPSLFIRRFDWSQGTTGLVYGSIMAISGTLGVLAGGWVADWWSERGCVDANVRVAWLATICIVPFGILYPLASTGAMTALLLIPYGVAPAAIQRMMPNTMRAQATAVYLFVINIVGMGLGPTVAAVLTEYVFHDPKSIHYSLLIVGAGAYVSAIILLGICLKSYRRSIIYLENWNQSTIT
jgi:MFS family permease